MFYILSSSYKILFYGKEIPMDEKQLQEFKHVVEQLSKRIAALEKRLGAIERGVQPDLEEHMIHHDSAHGAAHKKK